jgi:thiol:disulfide interchange protein
MDSSMKRKAQNNSLFARLRRSKYQRLIVTACFILWYSMLLYVGSMFFHVAGALGEGGERLPSFLIFLIVGLIILASSLLSKMFQNWLREKRNNRDKGNNGV